MREKDGDQEWDETEEMSFQSAESTGLDADVVNEWSSLDDAILRQDASELHPLRHYEQRQREQWGERFANEIMKRSDAQKISLYDALVDEYNAARPRLVANSQLEEVRDFQRRAVELIKQRK